jgi:hypothetical protein
MPCSSISRFRSPFIVIRELSPDSGIPPLSRDRCPGSFSA